MAKNGFHASKGIAGTASIMAANVVRTSEAMSSVFPPFDNGARGAALPSVELSLFSAAVLVTISAASGWSQFFAPAQASAAPAWSLFSAALRIPVESASELLSAQE